MGAFADIVSKLNNQATPSKDELEAERRYSVAKQAEKDPFLSTLAGTLEGTVGGGSAAALGNIAGAVGAEGASKGLYDAARSMQQHAAPYMAPQTDYKSVEDLSSGWDFVKANAAQGLGSMVPIVAGRAVGGMPAGLAAAFLPQHGETVNRIKNDSTLAGMSEGDIAMSALPTSVAQSALDYIVPGEVVSKGVGQALKGAGSIARGAGVVGTGMGIEGLTEAGQEYLGQRMHTALNPSRDTSNDSEDILQNFLGGMVGAGPITAVQGVKEAIGDTGDAEKAPLLIRVEKLLRTKWQDKFGKESENFTPEQIQAARDAARGGLTEYDKADIEFKEQTGESLDEQLDNIAAPNDISSEDSFKKSLSDREAKLSYLAKFVGKMTRMEDQPEIQELARKYLEAEGSDAKEVVGKELVGKLREFKDRGTKVKSLISDIDSLSPGGKFSKQSADKRQQFEDTMNYLESELSIDDENMAQDIASAISKGSVDGYRMAVEKFLRTQAQYYAKAGMPFELGLHRDALLAMGPQDEVTVPKVKREKSEHALSKSEVLQRQSEKAPTPDDKNELRTNWHDREFLRQKIGEYVDNEVQNGSEAESLKYAFNELINHARTGALTETVINKVRNKIGNLLGERGVNLLDTIMRAGAHHYTAAGNDSAAATMQKASEGEGHRSALTKFADLVDSDNRREWSDIEQQFNDMISAYGFGRMQEGRGILKKQSVLDRMDELDAQGEFDKSAALNRMYKKQSADPMAIFKSQLNQFPDATRPLVQKLVRDYYGEIEGGVKNETVRGSGSGVLAEDENDFEAQQDTATAGEGEEDTGLADKAENETGTQGTTRILPNEPVTFGQTARNVDLNLRKREGPGAPIGKFNTYEHPNGELDTLLQNVRTEFGGARTSVLKVSDWANKEADEWAAKHGADEAARENHLNALLDDAAHALIMHDMERSTYLSKQLKNPSKVLHKDARISNELAIAQIKEELRYIKDREDLYKRVGGKGADFFADKSNSAFRYIRTEPATQHILEISERDITAVKADKRDEEARGIVEKGNSSTDIVKRSFLGITLANGNQGVLDIAALVKRMIEHNQPADITGKESIVSDKRIVKHGDKEFTDFIEAIKVAFMNTVGSLYTNDLFSGENAIADKENLFTNKFALSSEDVLSGMKLGSLNQVFSPGMVIWRDDATGAYITYGEAFRVAARGARGVVAQKITDKPFSAQELTRVQKNGAVVGTLNGKDVKVNAGSLIRTMMERAGIDSMVASPVGGVEGVPRSLAAELFRRGIEVLEKSGVQLKIAGGEFVKALGGQLLWEKQYGEKTHPVYFSDLSKQLSTEYEGSFNLEQDETTELISSTENAFKTIEKYKELLRKVELTSPTKAEEFTQKIEDAVESANRSLERMFESMGWAPSEDKQGVADIEEIRKNSIKSEGALFDVSADEGKTGRELQARHAQSEADADKAVSHRVRSDRPRLVKGDPYVGKVRSKNSTTIEGTQEWVGGGWSRPQVDTSMSTAGKGHGLPADGTELPASPGAVVREKRGPLPDQTPDTTQRRRFDNTTTEQIDNGVNTERARAVRAARTEMSKAGDTTIPREPKEPAQKQSASKQPAPPKQSVELSAQEMVKLVNMANDESSSKAMKLVSALSQNGKFPNLEDIRNAIAEHEGTTNQNDWPSIMRRLLNVAKEKQSVFSKQRTVEDESEPVDALNDIRRRLNDAVKVVFGKVPGGWSGMFDPIKNIITISESAAFRDVAAHESWHVVKKMLSEMGEEGAQIIDTIERAMSSDTMRDWLVEQLGPLEQDAVKQLDDMEERTAFAFQFYLKNGGRMPTTPRARSLMQKIVDFGKALMGIRNDLVKTGKFFDFVDSGAFIKSAHDKQLVLAALNDTRDTGFYKKLSAMTKPVRDVVHTVFAHAADRITEMNIPAYTDVLKRFQEGYLKKARTSQYSFFNEFTAMDKDDKSAIAAFIKKVEEYKRDAGKEGGIKISYNLYATTLPEVFDAEKINKDVGAFKAALKKWGGTQYSDEKLDELVNEIILDGHSRKVTLNSEKLSPWLTDDINKRAFSYIRSSVHDAEMARMGDVEGKLKEGGALATEYQRKVMDTFIKATTGKAHSDMNPSLRRLYGAIITGINMSLLPFAIFSQMVEPLQLAFRGNNLPAALDAAYRGFKDLPRSWGAKMTPDKWERISSELGLIADMNTVSIMSNIANDIPLQGKMEKINRMFFRYNGMEQWARSMHTAATKLGMGFIKEHDQYPNKDSVKSLAELGLKRGEVKYTADGDVDVSDPKVRAAVIKFVTEAMGHPDTGTNAMWMNDPRFALVSHLKRFTFGFSYYINSRAVNYLWEGDYAKLAPLALAVPWMIAVSTLKEMLLPGDDDWKKKWGVSDYLGHGIERASLIGRWGIPLDVVRSLEYGGTGVEALSPAADISGKIARGVAQGNGWEAVLKELPGHQIYGM